MNLTAGMALTRRRSQTKRRPVFQVDMMKYINPAIRRANQPPLGIFSRLATASGVSTSNMPPATREACNRDQPKARCEAKKNSIVVVTMVSVTATP